MKYSLTDFTEKLVPISDFSQGKAGKIYSDVAENNSEYIVLKNNQPTAVLLSINEYKALQDKIEMMERFLEKIENMKLLQLAESRKGSPASTFEEFLSKEGYDLEEIMTLAEQVEFEQ